MFKRCHHTCERKNHIKAESTGWRATFYYPGGGTYKGCWLQSQHHFYGVKTNPRDLCYDGQWRGGKRHGHGTMRRRQPHGDGGGACERVYVGEWRDDMKCGEGKHFFENGVYYGWWQQNRRHGLGIMWYKDKRIYLGEWQADVWHGVGVLFCANGNRYEGHFARGYKNGEGTFYHMHTGQIQKGMWENDVCKVSLMQDDFRHQADRPTEYAIPQCHLAQPDEFVRALFQRYMPNAAKPTKSLEELKMLNFVHKMQHFAKFEPKSQSNSKFHFADMDVPCTCRKIEQPIRLRQRAINDEAAATCAKHVC